MKLINFFQQRLAFFIIGVVFIVFYFPLTPDLPSDGLDPSWLLAISYGLGEKLRFGHDIVFTYGPLGAAYIPGAYPGIFTVSILFWASVLTCFFLVIRTWLGEHSIAKQLFVLSPLVLVVSTDAFILFFLFSVVVAAPSISKNWWITAIISAGLGLIALAKFTFAVVSVAALIPLVINSNKNINGWKKHFSWGSYTVSFFIVWILAGQRLTDIYEYIGNSIQITGGYVGAMGSIGPWTELIMGVILLLYLYAIIIHNEFINFRRSDKPSNVVLSLIEIFSSMFIAYVAFKQGFVRHDEHVLAFVSFIGAALASYSLPTNNMLMSKKFGYSLVALWFFFWTEAITNHNGAPAKTPLAQSMQFLLNRWHVFNGQGMEFSAALNAIKNAHPFPLVTGTVDIASVDISRVLANGLNWAPRPVIQSYSAYTPKLAQLNGDHMASVAAPEHFFIKLAPIDGHMAMQEDPLLWPSLLTRYDVSSIENVIHMQRLSEEKIFVEHELKLVEKDGFWKVPSEIKYDFALLSAEPETSFIETIKSIIFKPEIIYIEVELFNGEKRKSRFISALKNTPFIASPFIESDADFLLTSCLCDALNTKKIVAFRFVNADGNQVNTKNSPFIKFIGVKSKNKKIDALSRILELSRIEFISGSNNVKTNKILLHNGEFVANAHANSILSYKPSSSEFELCFGIRQGAWEQAQFDGVRYLATNAITKKVLLDVVLDPKLKTKPELCKSIVLPTIDKVELLLETQDNGSPAYDWAYWQIKNIRKHDGEQ